jgi:hypothetical protein
MGRRREWVWRILVLLAIVGLVAWRLPNLGAFSLSNDEGAYLMWAWLVHSGHPLYTQTVSVSAPLFIELLSLAFSVGGISLVTGRVLVLVFFAAALTGLAWLGLMLGQAWRSREDRTSFPSSAWLGALVSVIAFGVAPLAFRLSRSAMGEIPATSLVILAVALAVAYRRKGGVHLAILSGLSFSLSLLVKALNPLVMLPILWLLWRGRWGEWVRAAVVWGAAATAPVVGCLLLYDPAALYDQAVAFRFELRRAFPWRPRENWSWVTYSVRQQWGIVVLGAAGLLVGAFSTKGRDGSDASGAAEQDSTAYAARDELGVSLFWLGAALLTVLTHSPLFPHHTIILLPPLALLAGQGAAAAARLLSMRRLFLGGLGLLAGGAFLASLPMTVALNQEVLSAQFGREAAAVDVLRQVTRPDEDVVVDNLLLAFEADRQTPPPMGDIAQVAINSGRQSGERLTALSEEYPVAAVANWALRLPYMPDYMAWVDDNFLVQRPWDDYHILYFARKPDPEILAAAPEAVFEGGVALVGHRARVVDGEVWVDLYWRTETPLEVDYTVFVHLYDADGRLLASHDGPPFYGYLPASDWLLGETVPDRHDFALPSNLAQGEYQLAVGLYDPATGDRLPLVIGGDVARVDTLELP